VGHFTIRNIAKTVARTKQKGYSLVSAAEGYRNTGVLLKKEVGQCALGKLGSRGHNKQI
jgi:hypothetical protein